MMKKKKMSRTIEELFGSHMITDPDGNQIHLLSISPIDAQYLERIRSSVRLSTRLEELSSLLDESTEILVARSDIDRILAVQSGKGELISVTDQITYESLSPFQLVEYCYENDDGSLGPWFISCVGLDSLQSYKSFKFGSWRENMFNAFNGCARAFLPEIKRGRVLSNVFDSSVFPMDPADQPQWQTEHNGKLVYLPRPVKGLRIWNSTSQSYDEISPLMDGAPPEGQEEAYWVTFLQECRENLGPKFGEEFVDDCLVLSVDEIKEKYLKD